MLRYTIVKSFNAELIDTKTGEIIESVKSQYELKCLHELQRELIIIDLVSPTPGIDIDQSELIQPN